MTCTGYTQRIEWYSIKLYLLYRLCQSSLDALIILTEIVRLSTIFSGFARVFPFIPILSMEITAIVNHALEASEPVQANNLADSNGGEMLEFTLIGEAVDCAISIMFKL